MKKTTRKTTAKAQTKGQTTRKTTSTREELNKIYFDELNKQRAKETRNLLNKAQATIEEVKQAITETERELKSSFPEIVTAYETNAILRYMEQKDSPKGKATKETETEYTNALYTLAKMLTYSVLKKCIDPQRKTGNTSESNKATYNTKLQNIKNSIAKDFHLLERTAETSNKATELYFDENGNLKERTADKDSKKAFDKLITQTLESDGLSLVHDAVETIEKETLKAFEERNNMKVSFMDTVYTIRQLRKKVVIKDKKSVDGWKTEEVTPTQIVFRAVRQVIEDNGNTRTQNSYSYIADISKDPESETVETIYIRLGKYADLGGFTVNSNGITDIYTTPETALFETCELLEKLNLTVKQAETLRLRQQGNGVKAISTYFGTSTTATKDTLKQIQKKAEKMGYTVESVRAMKKKATENESTIVYGKNYIKATEKAFISVVTPTDIICKKHFEEVKERHLKTQATATK